MARLFWTLSCGGLCVADLAVSRSGPLGSVVASAGPTQPRGPEDQHDVAQDGPKRSSEKSERPGPPKASRTEEVTTLTAKQHFPSHAHTSTAVTENNSVFQGTLLCKTHKISQTMKCIKHDTHEIASHKGRRPLEQCKTRKLQGLS